MKKELALPDLNQATHWMNRRLSPQFLAGKPLLVYFWSVSCHFCRQSLPELQRIRDIYGNRLIVLSIHMPLSPDDRDLSLISRTCAESGITESVLIDNDERLAAAFDNRFVPAYYLFDSRHWLIEYQLGPRGVERIGRTVQQLFDQEPSF